MKAKIKNNCARLRTHIIRGNLHNAKDGTEDALQREYALTIWHRSIIIIVSKRVCLPKESRKLRCVEEHSSADESHSLSLTGDPSLFRLGLVQTFNGREAKVNIEKSNTKSDDSRLRLMSNIKQLWANGWTTYVKCQKVPCRTINSCANRM